MSDGLAGYDRWKTDVDADAPDCEPGIAEHYHCLDCAWRGRGGLAAFDHHRSATPHHRIALRAWRDRPVSFSCCASAISGTALI